MTITVFRQVSTIRELMRSGQWNDKQAIALAEAWQLEPGKIHRIANEAQKALLNELPDDEYAEMITERIQAIGSAALEEGNHNAALKALDMELKVSGYWARMAERERQAVRKALRDEQNTINAPSDPQAVIRLALSDHRIRHIARKELEAYADSEIQDDPPDSAD